MKKISAIAFVALMICALLCGCQFAREDGAEAQSPDRLVGISLKPELYGEPDGYDEDGNPYWQGDPGEEADLELTAEQIAALARGEDIVVDAPAGEIGPYAVYFLAEDEGIGLHADGWPGDTHTAIHVTDEGTTYRLEATAYACDERIFNADTYNSLSLDAVYQRPDGSLYTQSMSGVSGLIGGYTLTLTEERSETDGKEKCIERVEIEANVEWVDRLTEARVLAFDAEHVLLSETTLDLAAGSFDVTVPDGAAYLLLEETTVDQDGAEHVRRSAADWTGATEKSLFRIYIPNADGTAQAADVHAK